MFRFTEFLFLFSLKLNNKLNCSKMLPPSLQLCHFIDTVYSTPVHFIILHSLLFILSSFFIFHMLIKIHPLCCCRTVHSLRETSYLILKGKTISRWVNNEEKVFGSHPTWKHNFKKRWLFYSLMWKVATGWNRNHGNTLWMCGVSSGDKLWLTICLNEIKTVTWSGQSH